MEEFSTSLDGVPEAGRIAATFGWFPALFGLTLIGLGGVAIAVWAPTAENGIGGAVVALAGGALVLYELQRRKNRLVLHSQGGRVAVYKGRALVSTCDRREVTEYVLHPLNTFKFLFLPGCWTVMGFYLAFTKMERPVTLLERGAWVGVGIGGLFALASLVYTRIVCKTFFVAAGGKSKATVLLTRADARRL